jgi:hypothetical protein
MTESETNAPASGRDADRRPGWQNWLLSWINWGKLRRQPPLPDSLRRDIGLPPLPRPIGDPLRWRK